MIRDEEIQRLVNYIKGLGLKVSFVSKKSDYSAFWYLDNSEIVVCKNNNSSKIETVLSLIHETGHAKHNLWEKNREVDKKFEKALNHVEEADKLEIDTQKRQRKIILNNEIAGTKYWHEIYHETNMKFPLWRLEAQMEFDVWQYETFYEFGSFAKCSVRHDKWKELVVKHKGKHD